jgi:hypothetical protein
MNQMSRRTPIPHDLFVREFPAVGFANPFKKCEDVA